MTTTLDPAHVECLVETLAATWPGGATEDSRKAARAALDHIAPQDFLESLLAARIVAAFHATMDAYRRAMLPDTTNAEAARQRSSANAASRSIDAALHLLEKKRAPARPMAQPRHSGAPAELERAIDPRAGFTSEEIAAAEHALDNDPVEGERAELAKRIPLHRYQDMAADEAHIAYAPTQAPTPAQLAVMKARMIAAGGKPTNGSGRGDSGSSGTVE